MDDTVPATFKKGGLKSSSPSKTKVQLLSRMIKRKEINEIPWINSSIPRHWSANGEKPAEAWFARRSRHFNHNSAGTANMEEFDYGLRQHHSKHEQEYTPDVYDSYQVLDWAERIKVAVHEGSRIDNYRYLNMSSKPINPIV